ncbi:hypothetical protein Tco_0132733 [Tanacetum coccineum]
MGDDTPDAYFSKIDSIITLLTDLGSTMDDDDIVTYAISGLSEKTGQQPVQHNNTMGLRPNAPLGFQQTQPHQPTLGFNGHQQALYSASVQNQAASSGSTSQETQLPHAFNTLTLQDLANSNWNMDTGASSHLNSSVNNLSTIFYSRIYPSVLVGNGKSIPVTNMGHSTLPTPYRTLHLNNVLITPNIVKNLISVHVTARVTFIQSRLRRTLKLFWLDSKRGTNDLVIREVKCYVRIDLDEKFGPVCQTGSTTSDSNQSLAISRHWLVHQLDVKNAFLHGSFIRGLYKCTTSWFSGSRIQIGLPSIGISFMGLKQYPSGPVFQRFAAYAARVGFHHSRCDSSLFIYRQGADTAELTFFLGLQVQQKEEGIFISQDKYVVEILKKFNYTDVKSSSTPVNLEKPLVKDGDDDDDVDVHLYRYMIRSLMYLTTSRPDIMFSVCACARFQVTPKTSHLLAVKRIFRYLKGKPTLGLWYSKDFPFELVAYTDSDYAGATQDRKSTSGGCQFLGNRLISWQCKKQTVVATSTTEAEYVAAASCCGQVLWIQNQLLDYGYNFMNIVINIDNNSTICIIENPVQHSKTKHIEIRHYFIRDCNAKKLIQMVKIHIDHNVADLLTKGFDAGRHVKRGRDTKIPQSSGPPVKVGDEVVHKKLGDIMERATTTASSLEAECQDTILGDVDAQTRFETTSKQSNDLPLSRGYTLGSREDSIKLLELMELCTQLFSIAASSSVLWIYLAQFWHTLKEDGSKYRLSFMLDRKDLTLTLDDFRTIFYLPQATNNNHDHHAFNNIHVDYADLLWEGLYYSLKHPTTLIPNPRFTKLIVSHYMTTFPDISRRARDRYHNLEDDDMVKSIFNLGKHKDGVGMKILSWMITDEIKLTYNYQMYAMVFGVDVPTTQLRPIDSTQGTHRTTSAPRTPNPKIAEGKSKQKSHEELKAKQNVEIIKEYWEMDCKRLNTGSITVKSGSINGSVKHYKIFSAMLYDFDRQDVLELYRLVKERFQTASPEGYDLLLLGDLKTMMEPNEEDEL